MKNKKKWVISFFLILLSFHPFIQRNKVNYYVHSKKNIENIEPFLSDIYVGSYIIPGVSEAIPSNQILKIGVLDDLNDITGIHAWKGALLAAKEINEDGGILINGTQYYIGLVSEDTNEMDLSATVSEGIDAAEKMINDYQPHFITGGGLTETVKQYIEVVMDNKIPFISTGASWDTLCQNVLDNYERYKYFFMIMLNATFSMNQILKNVIYLANYLNITYGGTVNKIAILREDIPFTLAPSDAFKVFLPYYGLTVVEDIAFPLTATSADFETYWNQIEAVGTQITISMIGMENVTHGPLIARQYQALKPHCLLIGFVNMPSHLDSYWDDTSGACQFEVLFQLYNTSKTSLTIPFWNSYVKEYDTEPLYTGILSYDAVYLLTNAVNESQSFDPDTIVRTLEKINASNPSTGAAGNLAFTRSHGVLAGWPYGYTLLTQWQNIDGTKVVIDGTAETRSLPNPNPLIYPDATGSLRLPYWGINGLLTDPPDPPRDFTLDSDAGNPDNDGEFNLSWTDSEGADNYSVYMSDKNITYISKKFDLLVYQTAASTFSISGLKEGDYYFVVVAYNNTGETMSNNVVHVTIPGGFPFEIVIIIVVILIIIMIPATMIILKRKSSGKEVTSKKEKEIKKEKEDIKGHKQKKPKSFDSSITIVSSRELEEIQETEVEIGIEKEQHSCIVHGGKIVGAIYICPSCETYYCMECASVLKFKGETCQVCKNEIEL